MVSKQKWDNTQDDHLNIPPPAKYQLGEQKEKQHNPDR
jgi:hypothetical protein